MAWVVAIEPPLPGLEPEVRGSHPGRRSRAVRKHRRSRGRCPRSDLSSGGPGDGHVRSIRARRAVRAAWMAAAERIAADPGHARASGRTRRPTRSRGRPLYTGARGRPVLGRVAPWARGRGIQGALISARARLAETHACYHVTAQAEPDSQSERNMLRLGLERLLMRWRLPRGGTVSAPLRLERTGPGGVVARVVLNRPDGHNAFDANSSARAPAAPSTPRRRRPPDDCGRSCWPAMVPRSAPAPT